MKAYKQRSNDFEMSFSTFKSCLAKVPQYVPIHFLGMAEPWLNSECTRMISYAHEKGYQISVSTTLIGMNPPDVDLLESIPFEAFIIHVPSNDSAMRIKIDDSYLNLLNKICQDKIRNLKFKRFGKVHPKVTKMIEGIEEAVWPLMNRANNIQLKNIPLSGKIKGKIKCHRKRSNILLPNADVALCCNDYGLQHIIGNLLNQSYDSLFHSNEFRRVKAGMHPSRAVVEKEAQRLPCSEIIFYDQYVFLFHHTKWFNCITN